MDRGCYSGLARVVGSDTLRSNMSSRGSRWLVVGTLLLLGVAAVGLWRAGVWGAGPRYAGHPVGYWFPVRGMSVEDWQEKRLPVLREAGPELAPVLVAAARAAESIAVDPYAQALARLPAELRSWFPSRLEPWQEQERVRMALWAWLGQGAEHLRAFTNVFASLPEEARIEALHSLRYRTNFAEILDPFWRRWAGQSNEPVIAAAAGLALLRPRVADDADLARAVRAFAELPAGEWARQRMMGARLLVFSCVPYTDRLGMAEPWLKGWLDTGAPPARAAATLLLPFIAPDRYPVAGTLAGALPGLGTAGLADLQGTRWFDRPEQRAVRRDFAVALAPYYLGDALASWEARWNSHPDPKIRALLSAGPHDLPLRALNWVLELGPDAAPAAPYLTGFFGERSAEAFRAAQGLARIGPIAPETIPALIPGLTNEVTVAPLVLLLAAYGPAARTALPALEALAADTTRFGRHPSLESFGAAEAERLGLPAPAAMRALRRTEVTPAKLEFGPNLAHVTLLPHLWPRPGANPGASTGTNELPFERVSLARLAAGAVERIRNGRP